jgi:hypothetical protein
MSLTYPILSDICAIKINELLTLNKSMNSRLNLYKTKLNDDITLIMSKISTQDVKIDLIHNLFNQYKASVGNTLNHKEIEALKYSQQNLINSIKNEYSNIIANVNTNIRDSNAAILEAVDNKLRLSNTELVNKELLERIANLEKTIVTMSTTKATNHLNTTMHGIHTELANINFRLNGLDSNCTTLDKKLTAFTYTSHKKHINTPLDDILIVNNYATLATDGTDDDTNNNWIKVTKKSKNKHPLDQ